MAFNDLKKFYKQLTVNYLLNPENWTQPKVNTGRSQMNNKYNDLYARLVSLLFICDLSVLTFGRVHVPGLSR